MARIRTIKPEIWSDEKFVELSFPARLLFIGLWNFADRDGRMVYSPKRIRMQIFPGDSVEIVPLVEELKSKGMVTIYEASNARILSVPSFARHQCVNAREPQSMLPANAVVTTFYQSVLDEHEKNPTSTVPVPSQHENFCEEGKGREGKGRERKGKEETSCVEPAKNAGSLPAAVAITSGESHSPERPIAGTLPLNDGTEYPIYKADVETWRELYPAVDVMQELRNMKGWCLSHEQRRKTKLGIKKFINSWLSREQDEAKGSNGTNQQQQRVSPAEQRQNSIAETNRRILARFAGLPVAPGDEETAAVFGGGENPVPADAGAHSPRTIEGSVEPLVRRGEVPPDRR